MSEETNDQSEEPTHVLRSFRVKNFKAIKDSGDIALGSLTVLIGNNGSGKSSLIEALESFCDIARDGLDEAMERWKGFEHIWHQEQRLLLESDPSSTEEHISEPIELESDSREGNSLMWITPNAVAPRDARDQRGEPMEFMLTFAEGHHQSRAELSINTRRGYEDVTIERERLSFDGTLMYERNSEGRVRLGKIEKGELMGVREDDPWENNAYPLDMMFHDRWDLFPNPRTWRVLSLDPVVMAEPAPVRRAASRKKLERDGSNVAEYLKGFEKEDPEALRGIIETLLHILPFAQDLQAAKTSELQRTVYLQLTEKGYKVPGWLLSTGTLRLVALLALMRDPKPSRLIVIEEIENGLDPRAIHLIVEEIKEFTASGAGQVILTTHSPYLLDLMPLESIILCEREDGEPKFRRPADDEETREWGKRFAPGKLYTMGALRKGKRP